MSDTSQSELNTFLSKNTIDGSFTLHFGCIHSGAHPRWVLFQRWCPQKLSVICGEREEGCRRQFSKITGIKRFKAVSRMQPHHCKSNRPFSRLTAASERLPFDSGARDARERRDADIAATGGYLRQTFSDAVRSGDERAAKHDAAEWQLEIGSRLDSSASRHPLRIYNNILFHGLDSMVLADSGNNCCLCERRLERAGKWVFVSLPYKRYKWGHCMEACEIYNVMYERDRAASLTRPCTCRLTEDLLAVDESKYGWSNCAVNEHMFQSQSQSAFSFAMTKPCFHFTVRPSVP